jgi:hypothetical protein
MIFRRSFSGISISFSNPSDKLFRGFTRIRQSSFRSQSENARYHTFSVSRSQGK